RDKRRYRRKGQEKRDGPKVDALPRGEFEHCLSAPRSVVSRFAGRSDDIAQSGFDCLDLHALGNLQFHVVIIDLENFAEDTTRSNHLVAALYRSDLFAM